MRRVITQNCKTFSAHYHYTYIFYILIIGVVCASLWALLLFINVSWHPLPPFPFVNSFCKHSITPPAKKQALSGARLVVFMKTREVSCFSGNNLHTEHSLHQ